MVEINDVLQWLAPLVIGVMLAVFAYINREGFRRGTAKGQSEVTTTVLANTIKELEYTKKIVEEIDKKQDEQKAMIIRLEERLKFTCNNLNELKERFGLPKRKFPNDE